MRCLGVLVASALLSACGDGGHDAAPQARKETVFDPMTQQLDRVKQQAETLPKERKDDLDRAIEADTQ
jgi:hypothetical protein